MERIWCKRGKSVKTGDMLLRFDTLLIQMSRIRQEIKNMHRSTKLKRSQLCHYSMDDS
jgi:hypothetical protein